VEWYIGILTGICVILAFHHGVMAERIRKINSNCELLRKSTLSIGSDLQSFIDAQSTLNKDHEDRMDYIEAHTGTEEAHPGGQESVGRSDAASVHAEW